MQKYIHYDPSPEEMHSYGMQVRSDDNHHYYTIHLCELSEGQRKYISKRYSISLNVLEGEQYLTLVRITDI